jgi:SAM-dependent methyltransferase
MLIADFVLLGVAVVTILALFTMLGSLYVWVPYVPTPHTVVKRMVELATLQGNEVVYDLGCGDGRLLIEAKRKHPGIQAIGYELPIGIYLLGKIRVFFSRLPITIHWKDFRKADLQNADVIFLYLVPEVFAKLEKKLSHELRKGTKVISHGFEFPGRSPMHVERVPLPSWHFMKPRKAEGPRIFVYEW